MQVSEIRAKYWKLATTLEPLDKTSTSKIQMLQAEMLTEIAVNLSEINDTLKRSVGLVNFEELGLQLSVALERLEPVLKIKGKEKANEPRNKLAGSES